MTAISSIIKNLAAASAIVGALGIGAALVATRWTASADSSQSSSSSPATISPRRPTIRSGRRREPQPPPVRARVRWQPPTAPTAPRPPTATAPRPPRVATTTPHRPRQQHRDRQGWRQQHRNRRRQQQHGPELDDVRQRDRYRYLAKCSCISKIRACAYGATVQSRRGRDGYPDTVSHPRGTGPGTNRNLGREDLNANPADAELIHSIERLRRTQPDSPRRSGRDSRKSRYPCSVDSSTPGMAERHRDSLTSSEAPIRRQLAIASARRITSRQKRPIWSPSSTN